MSRNGGMLDEEKSLATAREPAGSGMNRLIL